MYLLCNQEHTSHPPMSQHFANFIGSGSFRDFLTFYIPLCSKKLSVQCGLDCFNPMVERLAKMDGTQACRILTLCVSRSQLLLYTLQTKALKIVTKVMTKHLLGAEK